MDDGYPDPPPLAQLGVTASVRSWAVRWTAPLTYLSTSHSLTSLLIDLHPNSASGEGFRWWILDQRAQIAERAPRQIVRSRAICVQLDAILPTGPRRM